MCEKHNDIPKRGRRNMTITRLTEHMVAVVEVLAGGLWEDTDKAMRAVARRSTIYARRLAID